MLFHRLFVLLFPSRCVLCRKLLLCAETDFCHRCRTQAPEFGKTKSRFSFLAGWTAVWYYKEDVRKSLKRYKFYGRRSYAPAFGRMLAAKLQQESLTDFDILTWVPISPLRYLTRGYDQSALLAEATAKALGITARKTLRKIRNTPPQSGISDVYRRRANVLGAYRPIEPETLRGKRILLLDDIITTGATASECARTLLTAGTREVTFAAMAATQFETK